MAEAWTICEDCGRRWEWLCEDCAQEQADTHHRETGHQTGVRVTAVPTVDELRRMIGRAR